MNKKFAEMYEKRVKPLQLGLEKVMVGQKNIIRRITMALFAVGQRDFYSDGTRFLGTGHVLCEGGVGTGKCLAKATEVILYNNTLKKVEDIKVGCLLLGPDGKPRKVVSLGHGFGKMFKIKQEKAEDYVVNDEHILSLMDEYYNVHNICVKDFLKKNSEEKEKLKGYKILSNGVILKTNIFVEQVEDGEYFGFEIEGPDRLFLLRDFTVTHNTVLCKTLSRLLSGNSKRISGMPDVLASDITGCEIILLTGETKTVHGPLFCNVMLADEINRFPPKAQNAFIEALAEGSVSIGNETYKLQQPFFCLATQNPTEQKGTSKLQEALSDRFMFKLIMKETTEDEKVEIARKTHHFDLTNLNGLISPEEVYETREYFFDNTYVSDYIRKYCARVLYAINHPEKFDLFLKEKKILENEPLFKQNPALNDRAMLHLEGAAMMEAVMNERDYVLPEDVASVAPDVLRARLIIAESSLHLLSELYPSCSETNIIDKLIEEAIIKVNYLC